MRVLLANEHSLCAERSKNSTICANEVKASEQEGQAGQVTKSRLQRTALANSWTRAKGLYLQCGCETAVAQV